VWQPIAPLLPEAYPRIREVSDYFKGKEVKFTGYWHSPLVRAKETCKALAEYMGHGGTPTYTHVGLGPQNIPEWERRVSEWLATVPDPKKVQLSPQDFLRLFPDLSTADGKSVLTAVEEIVGGSTGGDILAISHHPLINLVETVAFDVEPRETLDYCTPICFSFHNGVLVDSEAHYI
jgi:broad specificity phosphatase PhoE